MIRTQIYITEQERNFLLQLSSHTGKTQSELIREAIDLFSQCNAQNNRLALLRSAKGMWQDYHDLKSLRKIREELDRNNDE